MKHEYEKHPDFLVIKSKNMVSIDRDLIVNNEIAAFRLPCHIHWSFKVPKNKFLGFRHYLKHDDAIVIANSMKIDFHEIS